MSSEGWERTRQPGIFRREGQRRKRYKVVYRDTAGKEFTKTFPRLKDAETFASDVRVRKASGAWIQAPAGSPPRGVRRRFHGHQLHLRPQTREIYGAALRLYIIPALGDRQLSTRVHAS